MRRILLSGLLLTTAPVMIVAVSATFDLELEAVALLGVAVGAVVALVPHRSPSARLAGLLVSFAVAFAGYAVRAAAMPDTSAGRAVVVGLVVGACALVAAATTERLPLWSLLLGAAAVAGGYEFTYAAAPPELAETAPSTATMLLITMGAGFVAAALVPVGGDGAPPRTPAEHAVEGGIDDVLEVTA